MILRAAMAADMSAILGIELASAEAPHWSEPVWESVLSKGVGGPVARACFVAEIDGHVHGFAVVSVAGTEAELESVAVEPTVRRMGVGRALCSEVMVWARSRGAKRMGLEVRASSEGAAALYASLGFSEEGRRRGYYKEPIDDAVLMSMRLDSCRSPARGFAIESKIE